jgi:hypothetical protein
MRILHPSIRDTAHQLHTQNPQPFTNAAGVLLFITILFSHSIVECIPTVTPTMALNSTSLVALLIQAVTAYIPTIDLHSGLACSTIFLGEDAPAAIAATGRSARSTIILMTTSRMRRPVGVDEEVGEHRGYDRGRRREQTRRRSNQIASFLFSRLSTSIC